VHALGTPVLWLSFVGFVLVMLALDLGIFNRSAHTPSTKEALGWSAVWIAFSLLFAGGIGWYAGLEVASEYLTAYVVEKSLSVDNLFVFVLVFKAFKIDEHLQHRVLFWGILGALVLRATMIFAGAALLAQFHWLMYVFGGFLIYGGVKLFLEWRRGEGLTPEEGTLFKLVRRYLRMSKETDGQHFLTRVEGPLMATPLLGALILIELSDVVFALDSIPAIFAITQDPFVVFTSNVFAILGLRSLYFLLANALTKVHDLKAGLAGVLAFVGLKMVLIDVFHVPAAVSLGVILTLLALPALRAWAKPKPHPST
jgi:tellurite resistance protein TerC